MFYKSREFLDHLSNYQYIKQHPSARLDRWHCKLSHNS